VQLAESDAGVLSLAERKKAQLAAVGEFKVFYDFHFTDRVKESGITFVHRIVDDAGKTYKAVHYDHGNGIAAADVETVRTIVEKVCGEPPTVDVEARRVSGPVNGGAGALIEVVRQLDVAGIEPVDLGIHRATLDDVFLKLTGESVGTEEEQ